MQPFEILEHTADVGLRAQGHSLEELFANAASGFYSLVLDELPEGQAEPLELGLAGDSPEQLLVRFLNELVYLLFTKNLASPRFRFLFAGTGNLAVTGNFDPVDPSRLKLEVKSATYHQLRLQQQDGVWSAVVYFDV